MKEKFELMDEIERYQKDNLDFEEKQKKADSAKKVIDFIQGQRIESQKCIHYGEPEASVDTVSGTPLVFKNVMSFDYFKGNARVKSERLVPVYKRTRNRDDVMSPLDLSIDEILRSEIDSSSSS